MPPSPSNSGRSSLEDQVVELLRHEGPRTGAELVEGTRAEPLPLWRMCHASPRIHGALVGTRYLRLDRSVVGYARLSPSIRREFLTYTVLGLEDQRETVTARAAALTAEADDISRFKSNLARENMVAILDELGWRGGLADQVTFIIGGDVTYGMAHLVPRPESSTGRMVKGSDLDVIIVATDAFPVAALRALDDAVYRRKHYLLVHPSYREEIDYIIKRVVTVREQLAFDTFEHQVATKILDEGRFLCGSAEVYETVKQLVDASGAPGRLAELTAQADADRAISQQHLLETSDDHRTGEHFNLFYTREEGGEIY